jgi:hypothetical protein
VNWYKSIGSVLTRIRQIDLTEESSARRWVAIGTLITALPAVITTCIALYGIYYKDGTPSPVQKPTYDLFQREILSECESKGKRDHAACVCLVMRMKEIFGPELYEMVVLYHTFDDKGGEKMYEARHGREKGRRVTAALRRGLPKIISNVNAAAKECGLTDYIVRLR